MPFGVRLHVWGDRACFTRPEMKVERVSYDAITPSAARGILEAIHWKPAIHWVVDRIHVLRPIRFQSLRRNEVGAKIATGTVAAAMKRGSTVGLGLVVEDNRQQRAATLLVDVAYVIEAHFDLTRHAAPDDTPAKHAAMFARRAAAGQCFHQPCLGTREFPAAFAPLADGEPLPPTLLPVRERTGDLGWMTYAPGYEGAPARFFRATMVDGVIDVADCLARSEAA